VFIDGLGGFVNATVYPERLSRFFAALTNELQVLGATTLITAETRYLFDPAVEVPIAGTSAIVEHIISLRNVELRSQRYRLVCIIKVRESGYDTALREFRITDQGIVVAETFESAEAILTGLARPIIEQPPPLAPGENESEVR
jgi:circadian clock protein KaiC